LSCRFAERIGKQAAIISGAENVPPFFALGLMFGLSRMQRRNAVACGWNNGLRIGECFKLFDLSGHSLQKPGSQFDGG
jgi:hypothetical protein